MDVETQESEPKRVRNWFHHKALSSKSKNHEIFGNPKNTEGEMKEIEEGRKTWSGRDRVRKFHSPLLVLVNESMSLRKKVCIE